MNLKKLKKNSGSVQYRKHKLSGSGFPGSETLRRSDLCRSTFWKSQSSTTGFVLLFAVTLSSILLAIALGVSNVAFRELRFSTNARDTNDAFFSADTGIECALFYDKGVDQYDAFGGTLSSINCAGNSNIVNQSSSGSITNYYFKILNLGSSEQSCTIVRVTKDSSSPPDVLTTIVSKGYNLGSASSCPSSSANLVEREIKVDY